MSYPPPPGQPAYPPSPGGAYGGSTGGTPKRLRGRTLIRLAIIFFVLMIAAFVGGGIVLATKSLGKVNDFGRVDVGASGSVKFGDAGNYLAYYEADNVDSSIDTVPVPLITLTGPDGKATTLNTLYGGETRGSGNIKHKVTYSYNGHKGVAIYQFKIAQKGTYQVDVAQSSLARSGSDIAFGKSIAGGTVVGGLLIVLGVLLLVAAVTLLIIGLVKRSRHKNELANPYGGGYPPPGYGQGGPPPGYQQPGYQQPGYQQPGYQQPGYSTPPSYGATPGYGPEGYAQPGHNYPPTGSGLPPAGFGKQPPAGGGPSLTKE